MRIGDSLKSAISHRLLWCSTYHKTSIYQHLFLWILVYVLICIVSSWSVNPLIFLTHPTSRWCSSPPRAVLPWACMREIQFSLWPLSFSDLSTDNLRFLSSRQALADLAHFRTVMANDRGLTNAKWVAFGGSYPGSLAAWFRLKYPHLVHAAVATSAPVHATVNFPGMKTVDVSTSLSSFYNLINSSWTAWWTFPWSSNYSLHVRCYVQKCEC